MKKLTLTVGILSSLLIGSAYATTADIVNAFGKLGYKQDHLEINNLPINGMKSVRTPDGVFYITNDGKFITKGPIFDMQGKTPANIENANNLKLIAPIAQDAIVYKAPKEKYVVYVFSDYTCGYCKKLHNEINDYLDAGISVHYFAFPRTGLNSDVANDMQSIWSAKDRKAAFDNAYKGGKISEATSTTSSVKSQFEVGRKIGLTGTPAIILPNGELLAGYVPANELLKILENRH